jgi:uncharacterized protein (DUF2141 family)
MGMKAQLLPAVVFPAAALFLALATPAAAQTPPAGTVAITVVVRGLRSDRGHVRVGLYGDAASWPRDHGDVARCVAVVRQHEARCVIQAPRAGRYAFAFLHDEDDDGQMDKDVLGLPQEGYGFSNDVRPGLGAPSFESASFQAAAPLQVAVTTRYGI